MLQTGYGRQIHTSSVGQRTVFPKHSSNKQQQQAPYHHHSLAGFLDRNIEDLHLRHQKSVASNVDSEQPGTVQREAYRQSLLRKRQQILSRDGQTKRKFNMTQLTHKLQQLAQRKHYQVWVSPLHLRNLPFKMVGEADRLLTKPSRQHHQTDYDENDPHSQQNSNSSEMQATTYFNNNLRDCGEAMNCNATTNSNSRKNAVTTVLHRSNCSKTKSGLQRLLEEYGKLERKAQELSSQKKLVLASRELRLKSQAKMDELVLQNNNGLSSPLRQAFVQTNQHFIIHMRKQPDLVQRILDSLCNYGPFDIRSFIRYHLLLVTRQADTRDKSRFMTSLIFRNNQHSMPLQNYQAILRLITGNPAKLSPDKSAKLVQSMVRITLQQGSELVSRKPLQELFVQNEDVTEVLISLLYLD